MIIYYDQIDSTNRIAKELVMEGKPSGTIVRAGKQTAGKGQHGRTFDSPVGGLYFSLLLQPQLQPEHLSLVTLATGLACADVLRSIFNLEPQIKWPNDIYIGDKKVAGILCENITYSFPEKITPVVVIGVGLNVNNTVEDFHIELQSIVTTLFECLQSPVDLSFLLSILVPEIIKNVGILSEDPQPILTRWQNYDYLIDKSVVFTAGSIVLQGTGTGILPTGCYQVVDYQGVEHRIVGGQLRPQF